MAEQVDRLLEFGIRLEDQDRVERIVR